MCTCDVALPRKQAGLPTAPPLTRWSKPPMPSRTIRRTTYTASALRAAATGRDGDQWQGDTRTAATEPALRIITRRLREIMSAETDGQQKLDKIVRAISGIMVAEVCSIYLKRQDGSLELFATEGLNPSAIHNTFMKRGEGLVGRCAEIGSRSTRPTPRRTPRSPIGRRRARSRSIRCWRCRSCAAAMCSACWSTQNKNGATIRTKTSRCSKRRRWCWPSISSRATSPASTRPPSSAAPSAMWSKASRSPKGSRSATS